jgi:predicted ATPase/class 3 adenylate cyclase
VSPRQTGGGVPTVTFLLTDIEGSTRRWERDPGPMRAALAAHDRLVRRAVRGHRGRVLTSHGEGDSFFAVFETAPQAVEAASSIQRELRVPARTGGLRLRVRMAIHSGQAGADVRGPAANRCGRLRACAHGGQVLVSSAAVRELGAWLPAGTSLRDLGEHWLRDLADPERIYQLVIRGIPAKFPRLRSLGAFDHNLPRPLGAVVDRRQEVSEVRRLLTRSRLLTVHGAGGAGKTTLAIMSAAGVVRRFPGGVWFVDLAGSREASLVPALVSGTLGIREAGGRSAMLALADRLRQLPALLVLDNCEHLVAACADLVETLLRACPELRVLATSREVLNVPGEEAYRVPSLSIPPAGSELSLDALRGYQAIQLFLERAAQARPGLQLSAENAAAITQICRRLDGMPLALELAAARLKVMTPEEVLDHLEHRFELLVDPGRRLHRRHHTLRATVDWSYTLLDEAERMLFERLSVFAGADLDAIRSVCAGGPVVPDGVVHLVHRLVDKSLVTSQERRRAMRHQVPETLRAYGRERLGEVDATAMGLRHLRYYLSVAEQAEEAAGGPDEAAWSERLADEEENLRLALATAAERDAEALLRLAAALGRFWRSRGRLSEGRRWLTQALEGRTERTALRARALNWLGVLAWQQQDYLVAEGSCQASLSIWQALGDRTGEGHCLINIAGLAFDQTHFEVALRYLSSVQQLYEELGDGRMAAFARQNIGLVRTELGALEEGRQLVDDALTVFRRLRDLRAVALTLSSVGVNALGRGDHTAARSALDEGLRLSLQIGDQQAALLCLEGLAWLAGVQGHAATAYRLLGAASAVRRQMGAPPAPVVQRDEQRWLGRFAGVLGEVIPELEREGLLLSLDDAAAFALSPWDEPVQDPAQRSGPGADTLDRRLPHAVYLV